MGRPGNNDESKAGISGGTRLTDGDYHPVARKLGTHATLHKPVNTASNDDDFELLRLMFRRSNILNPVQTVDSIAKTISYKIPAINITRSLRS